MESKEAGVNSLTGVAVASLIEKNVMNEDPHWVARKYNMLRSFSDPLHPSLDELKLLKLAKSNSKGAWTSVLRADELRSIMDDGDAFSGFEEPMPCFAPSYKRRKGTVEGDCGDYTDPTKIISGFSNTGNIESEMAYQRVQEQLKSEELHKTGSGNNLLGHRKVSVVPTMTEWSRDRSNTTHSGNNSGNSTPNRERSSTFQTDERNSGGGSGLRDSPSLKSRSVDLSDIGASVEYSGEEGGGEERDSDYEYRDSDTSKKYPVARRRKAGVLQAAVETTVPKKPVDPRKLRPPSYTDRILIHSLPDRHSRLTVQAYDLCDNVRISDHRAVSMTLKLQVNGAVSYKTPNSSLVHDIRREPKFDLFELTISNVFVKLGADDAQESSDEEDEEEEEENYRDTEESVLDLPVVTHQNPLHAAKSRPVSVNLDSMLSPSTSYGTGRSSAMQHSVEVEMSSSFTPSHMAAVEGKVSPAKKTARFAAAEEERESTATSRDSTISAQPDLEAQHSADSVPDSKRNSRKRSIFGFAFPSAPGDESSTDEKPTRPVSISRTAAPARKKSYFAFGGGKAEPAPPSEDAEDAILKEMAADSLAWKSEPGEWRKRVQEEDRRRKEERQAAPVTPTVMISKLNHQVKKTKKKRSADKTIDQLTVVFPLPSKDPLLTHRKLYDFSQAFGKLGADQVKIEKEM